MQERKYRGDGGPTYVVVSFPARVQQGGTLMIIIDRNSPFWDILLCETVRYYLIKTLFIEFLHTLQNLPEHNINYTTIIYIRIQNTVT